jgi:hypothetical protein
MEQFEEAGVTLVALSYDEPDALAAFAADAGITYPLLSDPDSAIISRFGILNTLVSEEDDPWHGIPFPGTYVTDADGVITTKFFENHLALRAGTELLLRAVLGEDVSDELVVADPTPVEDVTVSFDLDDAPIAAGVMRELRVHLRVPDGRHLYGEPVPEGMVATAVEIDDHPTLVVAGIETPPTSPYTLPTGETFQIYEGDVTLRVRLTHATGSLLGTTDAPPELTFTGRVRYQSCDDEACGLPATEPFEFSFPITSGHRVRFGNAEEGEMDSLPFFNVMNERRQ